MLLAELREQLLKLAPQMMDMPSVAALAELAIVPEPGAAAETAIVVEDDGSDVVDAEDEDMANLRANFAALQVCAVLQGCLGLLYIHCALVMRKPSLAN